jgi:hypothetical protein
VVAVGAAAAVAAVVAVGAAAAVVAVAAGGMVAAGALVAVGAVVAVVQLATIVAAAVNPVSCKKSRRVNFFLDMLFSFVMVTDKIRVGKNTAVHWIYRFSGYLPNLMTSFRN